MRTRTSFDLGAHQLGGHAIVLDARGGTWPVEFEDGAIMDGTAEEHVKEAARVLSSYVDLIAIRCFPKFENWTEEHEDPLITAYAKYATVPVINMETIVHPCQELAHMMALQDAIGDVRGKDFLLTWVPHPKPLNTAVANSALLIASKFGMNVRLLIPDEVYRLDQRYMDAATRFCGDAGTSLSVTTDVKAAYSGAHNALVSHCLPMRRNVKIADSVVDSPAFIGLAEAENRLHVQKAIMETLVNGGAA